MKLRIFLLFAILSQTVLAKDFGSVDTRAVDVSLLNILVSPAKYDAKIVRVFGIYYWSRDGAFLFLTRDHYEAFDTASALELAVAEKYLPTGLDEVEKLQGRPVTLEGTVQASAGLRGGPVLMPITRILERGPASRAQKAVK
jgi:hypothetical protein